MTWYTQHCLPGKVLLLSSFRAIPKWSCGIATIYFECTHIQSWQSLVFFFLSHLAIRVSWGGRYLYNSDWKCGCAGHLLLCPLVMLVPDAQYHTLILLKLMMVPPGLLTRAISNNLVHDDQLNHLVSWLSHGWAFLFQQGLVFCQNPFYKWCIILCWIGMALQ